MTTAAPEPSAVADADGFEGVEEVPAPVAPSDRDHHLIVARGISKKYALTTHAAMAHGVADLAAAILGRRHQADVLRSREFWALRNVDFELRRGESVGVLGVNGAGKSTLLRMLYGLTKPDEGTIQMRGRVGGLLSVGAGFNSLLSGRENALAEISLHGHTGPVDEALEQIAAFADIGSFMDAPIRTYSQGMRLRLGYAITAFLDPDVLLVDEVLSVGDTAFREKCARHVRGFLERGGSMVLVSHSVWMIQGMCERAIVLDKGNVTFEGTATDAVRHYLDAESLPASGDVMDEPFSTVEEGPPAAVEDEGPTVAVAEEGSSVAVDDEDPTVVVAVEGSSVAVGDDPTDAVDHSPPITIEKVTVDGPDGGSLALGYPAQITVDYRSTEAFANTVWAVVIWSADELAVLTGAMTEEWGAVEVAEGPGQLRCLIPALPLAAGAYLLRIGALDAETRLPLGLHGFARDGTSLRVEGAPPSPVFERLTGAPLTALDVEWESPAPVDDP